MIRSFSEILTYKRGLKLTLASRLLLVASMFLGILIAAFSAPRPASWVYLSAIAFVELGVIKVLNKPVTILRALAFICFFVFLSLSMRLIGIFLFNNPLNPTTTVYAALLLVEAFLAITIFLQLVSPSELVWLASKVGFKEAGRVLALVLTHLSSILLAYSEVYVVVKLKKTRSILALKPLLVYTIEYGGQINEAIHLYGLPDPVLGKTKPGGRDLLVTLMSLALILTGILLLSR